MEDATNAKATIAASIAYDPLLYAGSVCSSSINPALLVPSDVRDIKYIINDIIIIIIIKIASPIPI